MSTTQATRQDQGQELNVPNTPQQEKPQITETDKQFFEQQGKPTESSSPKKDKWQTIFLGALALIASVHLLYFARAILFPMTLSVILFFLFSPIVRSMTKRRIPESLAAGIVVFVASAVIGGIAYVFIQPATLWVANAPQTLKQAERKLEFLIKPLSEIERATDEVTEITKKKKNDVIAVSVEQPPLMNDVLNLTFSFVGGIGMTVVLVFLLLAVGNQTSNSVVALMPTIQDKSGFLQILNKVEKGISRYLITITAINISLGIIVGSILAILGFPDPVLLGIMVALFNYVPFLGGLVGVVITFLIGVVNVDSTICALAGPLLYCAINVIEGNLITPTILGKSMKLNPAIVFIFIVFCGWIWGVGGMLIAVPVLGILKIISDHYTKTKTISNLLGHESLYLSTKVNN